jgi:cytochrome subunit of sulfide dehydrogenase
MNIVKYIFLLLSLVGLPSVAQDKTSESKALHARTDASMCSNCHGTEGRAVKDSAVPSIAGLPRDYMVQQMQAFKDGSRPATIMHQITKGLTEAQIASMADYFAAQPR